MHTSASATEIVVPDEILPIGERPKFINLIAAAVWDAGFEARAWRIEDCGKYRSQRCEEGHVTRRHRFCGCRSCSGESCSHRKAQHLIDRFSIHADHAIKRMRRGGWPKRFTYVDLRFDCPHAGEAIYAQVTRVIDKLLELGFVTRKEIESREPQHLALWTYAAGLDDLGHLVVRVLAFDDFCIELREFAEAFGAISADAHVVPLLSIHRFIPLMFAVTIPKDPALAAAMELAFIKIRRIRTVGMYDLPDEEELSVEEGDGKTSTINPDPLDEPNEPDVPHKHNKLCPICHKRIVEESAWMPAHLPLPMPDKITYYPASD